MTPLDVTRAAHDVVVRTCAAQGLPEKVNDANALRQMAVLVARRERAPAVTGARSSLLVAPDLAPAQRGGRYGNST